MLDKKLMQKIFDLQIQIEQENKGLTAYFNYCLGGLSADISNPRKHQLISVNANDYDTDGNQKLEVYLKQLGMYLVQGAA